MKPKTAKNPIVMDVCDFQSVTDGAGMPISFRFRMKATPQ